MAPTSIVTGANSGIGLEVAAGLLQEGHHVVLACRRAAACAAARAALLSRGLGGGGGGRVECARLDVSDLASVRRFASDFRAARPGAALEVLVSNAGVMGGALPPPPPSAAAPAGEDAMMLTNHVGPFLLARLLLPAMAPRGRVVVVGSEAHRRGRVAADAGGRPPGVVAAEAAAGPGGGNWYARYAASKLAQHLAAAELARRLAARGSGVRVAVASPGRVATNIFGGVGGLLGGALRLLSAAAFQTPAQGARTPLAAALGPLGAAPAGGGAVYMHGGRAAAPSRAAGDAALAERVWAATVARVGLSAEEDAALWPEH